VVIVFVILPIPPRRVTVPVPLEQSGRGRAKVGMVEDVEHLRPELHLGALSDLRSLGQRQIGVLHAAQSQRIPPQVSIVAVGTG
jgi:hypothetical protein